MASEAKLDPMWVPKEILPATATIVSIEERTEATKRGQYTFYALGLDFGDQAVYQMDVKYGNKNFLINTLGTDVTAWRGKQVRVCIGEDGFKRIESA